MVSGAVEKDLRFVFQPAKGARVNHAVAITLEFGAPGGRRLGKNAAARFGAELGVGGKGLPLSLFEFFFGAGHDADA
jgi:hypothetical protein